MAEQFLRRDLRPRRNRSFSAALFLRDGVVNWWMLLFPSFVVFWVLGGGMLWIAAVPVMAWLVSHGWKRVQRFDAGDLLLVLGVFLGLRLGVAILLGDTQPGRTIGAAFSVFSWVGAWSLYRLFKDGDVDRRVSLVRGLLVLLVVQGILILWASALHPSIFSRLTLPLSHIFAESTIGRWATPTLASYGWLGDLRLMRSNGIMGASAWSGGFGALGVIFTLCGWTYLRCMGCGRILILLAFIGSTAALLFSLSRLSYAIVVFTIMFAVVFYVSRLIFKRRASLYSLIFLASATACAFFVLDIPAILARQDALRPGSSEARFASYLQGLEAVVTGGPVSTIFGFGFKPLFEEQGRGVGSESTYVSILVRGGIVAVIIFVAFLIWRFVEAMRSRDWISTLLLPALMVHAMSADLDAGTITIIFGVMAALTTRENHKVRD